MNERNKRLQLVIEETQKIRESIDVLAATEDKAILSAMGIVISDSESNTDMENMSLDESEIPPSLQRPLNVCNKYWKPALTTGLKLETSSYNWFEVVQYVEEKSGCEYENLKLQEHLDSFYSHLLGTLDVSANY